MVSRRGRSPPSSDAAAGSAGFAAVAALANY
jgi:hypothetical protein